MIEIVCCADMHQTCNSVKLQERGRVILSEERLRGLEVELSSKINEIADLNFDLGSLKDVVDTQLDQIRKLAEVW